MFVSNIILEYLILATGSPQQRGLTFCQLSRRMSNILIWTINSKGKCWLHIYYLESIGCWRCMLIVHLFFGVYWMLNRVIQIWLFLDFHHFTWLNQCFYMSRFRKYMNGTPCFCQKRENLLQRLSFLL